MFDTFSSLENVAIKPVTYSDAANANGDFDGTGATQTYFTVTGCVQVRVWGVCTVNGAGALGTIKVGTAASTSALCAAVLLTDCVADEIVLDASPTTQIEAVPGIFIIGNGADIIGTCATANITGAITWYCEWRPMSVGASVVAA